MQIISEVCFSPYKSEGTGNVNRQVIRGGKVIALSERSIKFVVIMSMMVLFVSTDCMAKKYGQNEKEMKLFKAYVAVTANESNDNVNRFCDRLDEWGYPNYFSFTQAG